MSYEIQASKDGVAWKSMAKFEKGDRSRFGVPFDENVAIKETVSFKHARYREGWIYVRLIINI